MKVVFYIAVAILLRASMALGQSAGQAGPAYMAPITVNGGTITGSLVIGSGGAISTTGTGTVTATALASNAPTISGGFSAGGTAASIGTTAGIFSFTINVGTGTMSSAGVLTMPFTAPHGWACFSNVVTADYASYKTDQSFSTTTTVTFTNYSRTSGLATAWTASDVVEAGCFPN